jgi:hypothetical protein
VVAGQDRFRFGASKGATELISHRSHNVIEKECGRVWSFIQRKANLHKVQGSSNLL